MARDWAAATSITDQHVQTYHHTHTDATDNLSIGEQRALKRLQQNERIIIKPADKGSMIVIMDRTQYIQECNRQLNNSKHYIKLTHTLQYDTQLLQRRILQRICEEGYINKRQLAFLGGPDQPRPRYFYILPKIHKDPESWPVPHTIPAGRPIVSDCDSESYQVAKFIDCYLNPLSQRHDSYVKDTYDFIAKVRGREVSKDTLIFTMDVSSLYTNIDIDLGMRAVEGAFRRFPDAARPDEAILELLHINLTRNDFLFNGEFYLQTHGTAMGKTFAPSYANLYMAEWEQTALRKCQFRPTLYLRFLDDIFGIFEHGEEHFREFVQTLNTHHQSIKVTSTVSRESVEFLDTVVFVTGSESESGGRRLATKVHFKSTDTHALLHRRSYHPRHTFKGIVKSQIIRFWRICTFEEDVDKATGILFRALRSRGYPRRLLRHIKATVRRSFLSQAHEGDRQDTQHRKTGTIARTLTIGDNRSQQHTHGARARQDNTLVNNTLTSIAQGLGGDDRSRQHTQGARVIQDSTLINNTLTSTVQGLGGGGRSRQCTQGARAIQDSTLVNNTLTLIAQGLAGEEKSRLHTQGARAIQDSTVVNNTLTSKGQVLGGDNRSQGHTHGARATQDNTVDDMTLIPFVQTYSKALGSFNSIVRSNFTRLGQRVPEFQACRLIGAYRKNRNVRDFLVRASLEKKEKPLEFFVHANFIYNTVSGRGRPITQKIEVHTTNVVYAIQCKCCGATYIGETRHSIDIRVRQHLYHIHKRINKARAYTHFHTHTLEHLTVMGLQSDISWDTKTRKQVEWKWIKDLNTINPWGLNERSEAHP
ncbi:hypothetical protein ACEWY4_012718 [Coilia grayii]|uniref:GIY-YIG domain-containing protein n=1 Tax=Coilia grayii TaxID=363190 RepID=A0ABD1JUF5_9TELE